MSQGDNCYGEKQGRKGWLRVEAVFENRLLILVHWSFTYNGQDMERTWMFFRGWVEKANMVDTDNECYSVFLKKNEENPSFCNNLDEPGGHYAK